MKSLISLCTLSLMLILFSSHCDSRTLLVLGPESADFSKRLSSSPVSPPTQRADASAEMSALMTPLYLPMLTVAPSGLSINTNNRAAVAAFYHDHYVGSESPPSGWNGSIDNCVAGQTSAAFKDAVTERLNYFRAMAGLPADVRMNAEYNELAQAAALMMSAQRDLSHFPSPGWACYTELGANGAASSNLSLGVHGSDAMWVYVEDRGAGNEPVGHRRWMLHPWTIEFGTGDIPAHAGNPAANALMVFGTYADVRPQLRDEFVAWPPPGYVPYQVVYPRWSFSLGSAGFDQVDFSAASVTMTIDGVATPVVIESADSGSDTETFGDKAIVWRPSHLADSADWPRPSADSDVTIRIDNVRFGSTTRTFEYTTIVFAP